MKSIKPKTLIKIIVSIGTLVFLLLQIDLKAVLEIKSVNILIPISLSIVITLIALSIMTLRWSILIREFLNQKINHLILFKYYLEGMFFNIFLPGSIGGDIIRTKRLSTKHTVTLKKATIITISERFAGIYGLAILLSFSFLFMNFPDKFSILDYVPAWILKSSPIIALSFVPVMKWLLVKKRLITTYSFIFKTIGVLLLAQMGDITIAWLFSNYFGLELAYSAFIFIMPFVYIATVLPISLGGLGVREGTFSGLMIFYGADISIAILISLLMYLVKVSVGLIGYGVYMKGK